MKKYPNAAFQLQKDDHLTGNLLVVSNGFRLHDKRMIHRVLINDSNIEKLVKDVKPTQNKSTYQTAFTEYKDYYDLEY